MIAAPPVAWSLERDRAALLVCVVGLGACVAASHLEAAVGAFAISPLLALALGAVGLAAGAWAARVARCPSVGVLLGGAAAALALVALWTWTRAVGLPLDATRRAPIGVLDALTALDELLLAGFAVAAARTCHARGLARTRHARGLARTRYARRPAREGWPLLGYVAISLTFIVLAMGCEPPAAAVAGGGAHPGPALICHLY